MIYHPENPNLVAMRYYQPEPKDVQIGKKTYLFRGIRGASASFCWVDVEDVQKLIDLRGGCCGGKRQIIYPASQGLVDIVLSN